SESANSERFRQRIEVVCRPALQFWIGHHLLEDRIDYFGVRNTLDQSKAEQGRRVSHRDQLCAGRYRAEVNLAVWRILVWKFGCNRFALESRTSLFVENIDVEPIESVQDIFQGHLGLGAGRTSHSDSDHPGACYVPSFTAWLKGLAVTFKTTSTVEKRAQTLFWGEVVLEDFSGGIELSQLVGRQPGYRSTQLTGIGGMNIQLLKDQQENSHYACPDQHGLAPDYARHGTLPPQERTLTHFNQKD